MLVQSSLAVSDPAPAHACCLLGARVGGLIIASTCPRMAGTVP